MQLINGTNKDVCNIIDAIMLSPSDIYDYYNYLINYNLNDIRNSFLDIVLKFSNNWIEEWLCQKCELHYKTNNEIDKNYRNQVFCNLMIFYGKFYSFAFKKEEIISEVCSMLDSSNPVKFFASLIFIEYSKLNLKDLTENEKVLMKKVINDNMKTAKTSIRIQALNIFGRLLNNNKITNEDVYMLV
jgi:hypothetical protein